MFKVGDKVKRSEFALERHITCAHCVPNGKPAICEVIKVRIDYIEIRTPDGTSETGRNREWELIEIEITKEDWESEEYI